MNPAAPELTLPANACVEPEVLVAGTAASAQLGELPDHVLCQPPRDVAAELLVVVGDLDVRHRALMHQAWEAVERRA